MNGAPEAIRDHWWWRPGWRVGRSFYTWHITFSGQASVQQLAAAYAPLLDELEMFDRIPVQWLHLTTQGLSFTDEVDRADVDAIVHAAEERLAHLEPCTVTVGPPHIDPESIQMPVRPAEPLAAIRTGIRQAIADVWGEARVPERADGWRPHVSLAYANQAGPSEAVVAALAEVPPRTAVIEVSSVSLIDLNRDEKMYVWRDVATAHLRNHC